MVKGDTLTGPPLDDMADVGPLPLGGLLVDRIASYKVPRRVLFFERDEIPLNRAGTKVGDDALIALANERMSR